MSAEFNTDLIVKEKYFPNQTNGIIVEVGAAGPDKLSFTKMFREEGWRCISIEPNPYFVNMHKELGNEIYQYACADYSEDEAEFHIIHGAGYEGESYSSIKPRYNGAPEANEIIKTKIRPLNYILEQEAKLTQEIDILIIDVEGWELDVMKGFDHKKYNPKIIILENWLHTPEYNEYMSSIGYNHINSVEYNYIYQK